MVDYAGIRCPVPNCEGYLKAVKNEDGDEVRCEYGHLVQELDEPSKG